MWYQVEYIEIYKTFFAGVLALTEMIDRGDGKDEAINWPTVCPPNCQPFCLGLSRRHSLTSIPITVLFCYLSFIINKLLVMHLELMISFDMTFSFTFVSHLFPLLGEKGG